MRIQHNITALNSYRQLNTNNNNVAKNLEKLSSGYRINRAGDDAAGLAISEKMRAQIKGLETAQKNANDGISLIQTAEGNLQEVHSMLNRMVELATQASNGTYSDANRGELQKEINSLNSEIDRIAKSANFNGLKLLDGSLSSSGASAGGLVGESIVTYKPATSTATAGKDATSTKADATTGSFDLTVTTAFVEDDEITIGGVTLTAKDSVTDAKTQVLAGGSVSESAARLKAAIEANDTLKAAYDVSIDGAKLTLTAKNKGLISTGAGAVVSDGNITAGGTGTGKYTVANSTAGVDAVADDVKWDVKDIVNVDGTEIKVDWSKLTEDEKAVLQKDWTSATAADAKAAAALMEKTINDAIEAHNNEYGSKVQGIKVEGTTAGFKFSSTQADGNSKVSFNTVDTDDPDKANEKTVLSKLFGVTTGAATIATAAPVEKLTIDATELNGKTINLSIDGQNVAFKFGDAAFTADSTAANIATAINTALGTALSNFDTVQGNTDDDTVSGKISVKVNDQGALEITNTTGKEIAFTGKPGDDVDAAKLLGISAEGSSATNGGLTLQVGDTNEDFQKITVSVGNMDAKSLGISDINIKTQEGAAKAIDAINAAIDQVSSTRGDLGALQNRLDHTLNNLGVAVENITAAEARIRDTDMAKEMMDFTKNNILTQAAQAMLAQANMIPQSVLQLLQ